MYGLVIAEAIRNGTRDSIKDSDHKPQMAKRGVAREWKPGTLTDDGNGGSEKGFRK